MARWIVIATLLLAMGASVPAWAGDREDCNDSDGSLTKADPARAVAACRRLAERGDATGQALLGAHYYGGTGVPQDYAQAAKWLCKAAQQGNAAGEMMLFFLYSNGQGVPHDELRGLMWLDLAAAQGLGPAIQLRSMLPVARLEEARKLDHGCAG